MKMACILWHEKLKALNIPFKFVNMVHDEWQTETDDDMEVALTLAKIQSDALREVGETLKLKCPMAGSYWSDDHNDYSIGKNWSRTH